MLDLGKRMLLLKPFSPVAEAMALAAMQFPEAQKALSEAIKDAKGDDTLLLRCADSRLCVVISKG